MTEKEDANTHWTFLSNHAHVLAHLARDPSARLIDVARSVGITERAAQRIVSQLESAGILIKVREGRRNHYSINENVPLRHPLASHKTIASLLRMLDVGELPRS